MDRHGHSPGLVSQRISRWFVWCSAIALASSSCAQQPAPQSPKSVIVWPDTVTLSLGDTLRFRALARSENDVPLDDRSVTWSTTDSTIVSVGGGGGLATAKRLGTVTIIAISEGITGSARVNVANRDFRAENDRRWLKR